MQEFLTIMATIAALGGVINSIVTFLGKSYFDKKMKNLADKQDQRNISFEAEMGKIQATKTSVEELTRTVESVKREIDIGKITYQIKYAKLHDKRMVIIEEMYTKVMNLNINLQDYMAPFQQSKTGKQEDFEAEQKEKQQKAFDSYNDLNLFYHTRKLYFEEGTRTKMEELLKTIRSKIWDFTAPERMKSYGAEHKDLMNEYKKRHEASDYIFDEIPKMLSALEKELQKMIGVEA
jgi:hypothetical protein